MGAHGGRANLAPMFLGLGRLMCGIKGETQYTWGSMTHPGRQERSKDLIHSEARAEANHRLGNHRSGCIPCGGGGKMLTLGELLCAPKGN